MRIGINALTLIPGRTGGVETYITSLLKSLGEVDAANEYVVFCMPQTAAMLSFDYPNFVTVPCAVPSLPGLTVALRLAYEQVVLPRKIRSLGIDAMVFAANIGSLRCPCPSILIVHDLISLYYAEHFPGQMGYVKETVLPRLIRASARAATRVVAISEFTKSEVVTRLGVPPEKVDVVYNGVDEHLGKQGASCESGILGRVSTPYVLFVGYHHLHKNLERLVRAFALMKDRTSLPHSLVIAGKEESGTEALLKEIESLGREDVFVTGMVTSDELADLYRHASLFVFPPLIEGFGMPPLEAMACGVPVVASNAGPLPEVVGDAAILFDPEDVESIAGAMQQVLCDAALADDLRRRGRDRVGDAGLFSWAKTARGLLNVIERAQSR